MGKGSIKEYIWKCQIRHLESHTLYQIFLWEYKTVTIPLELFFSQVQYLGASSTWWPALKCTLEVLPSQKGLFFSLKFLLQIAESRLREVQCGTEKGEKTFSSHSCCSECRPSVPPAGAPAMVWHLNHTIFTDLNTNGYCLIVSWFISQTSSPLPPAQLLQSKPLSLNRPDYYFPSKVLICVTST